MLKSDSQRAAHLHVAGPDGARPVNGATPRLSGDIRHLIPKLGLRDYWYPALNARQGGLAQAREGLDARRGHLPLPRRQRRRGGHPGRLPPSGRAPQRGRLPLPRHGGLSLPRLGVRRVRQERGGAVRRPRLGRVRQARHRGEDLPDAHAEGPRLRVDRRERAGAHRGGRPRGVLRRRGPRPHRPGDLAVQLGSGPRELDGLPRELRAPQRPGRGPHRVHRPRRPGRASHLRGQRLRRRRRREQLHAPQPDLRRVRQRLAVAEDELSPRLDLAAPAVRRAGAAADPTPADGPMVQRPPPARHVPGRVRLRPLHADVRAGRGEPDAGVVLPLSPAEERAPARVAARCSTSPCTAGSSSTTSRARTSA